MLNIVWMEPFDEKLMLMKKSIIILNEYNLFHDEGIMLYKSLIVVTFSLNNVNISCQIRNHLLYAHEHMNLWTWQWKNEHRINEKTLNRLSTARTQTHQTWTLTNWFFFSRWLIQKKLNNKATNTHIVCFILPKKIWINTTQSTLYLVQLMWKRVYFFRIFNSIACLAGTPSKCAEIDHSAKC